ncbi:MAG: MFS transporter [bacterium]
MLGVVSFLTDLSSEMIYPLLPVFFTGLVSPAAAAVYIGLMDGIAESTSSLLKIYAGRLSDKLGTRKPLALAGYALSGIARPLMALAAVGWQVIGLRFLDRVGKGVRTSPRDALLSESVPPEVRGLAFSFHRLMDHAGAICGPLVAMVVLYAALGKSLIWQQGNSSAGPEEMSALRWLFAAALLPGIAATFVLWRYVKDTPTRASEDDKRPAVADRESLKLPRRFYHFLAAVTLFTLGNSSDLFLIFYALTRFELGLGWVILLWVILHLSKIVFSLPGGSLSDRVSRKTAIMIGWIIYVGVYLAMPYGTELWMTTALLIVYGAYYGMTEGAERALVADFVTAERRGKAYGYYHGAVGLAALPASLLFGVLWATIGPRIAFLIGASLAAGALALLVFCLRPARD